MRDLIQQHPQLAFWMALLVIGGPLAILGQSYLRARKIQPRGFKWKQFRFEALVAVISIMIAGPIIGWVTAKWTAMGWIEISTAPAPWWMIVLEYVAYFFLFDTWFYWLHRWMHNEPMYSWIHKLHHKSTSPNMLTTLSVNPLESFINGGFVPIFLAMMPTVHAPAVALIVPTNIIMGLYVHTGYEFFPRWWNTSWATKWFITASFHDHHHRYFTGNFGGYTTIWDRICGTIRPKWESDYLKIKDRASAGAEAETTAIPAE
jgi:sterol desaturase/sphingolipid hydroxylase (fatty acid hydroxylase superfamily)